MYKRKFPMMKGLQLSVPMYEKWYSFKISKAKKSYTPHSKRTSTLHDKS